MRIQTNTIGRGLLKRIPLENVQVVVKRTSGSTSILLNKLEVASFKFPSNAKVILECRGGRTAYNRFDLGELNSLHLPWQSNPLAYQFAGVDFRLLVVAGVSNSITRRGEILGEADEIFPDRMDATSGAVVQESLLAGVPSDLGNIPWQVDFSEVYPILKINNRVRDIASLQKREDFRCLAIIPVVREVAEWLYVRYLEAGLESEAEKRWWKVLDADLVDEPSNDGDIEEAARNKVEWAREIAENFARKNDLFNKWLTLTKQGEI